MDEITRSTIRMHLVENIFLSMAKETTGGVREEILLIKVDIDSTTIQHDDERDRSNYLPHQHL